MDAAVNDKKIWYVQVAEVFKLIFSTIGSIFSYAFIGLKASTYDLFMYIFNSSSYKLDTAYKKTKDMVGGGDYIDDTNKKKEKVYKYSTRTLAKLEAEAQSLAKDLQANGSERSKVANVYRYKVREANGKITTGTMNGYSKMDVNAFLVNEGYTVYKIETSPMINFLYKDSSITLSSSKMSTKELVFWLTQLATYLKAGITLTEAVKILSRQMSTNKRKTGAFKSMSYELVLGASFSAAMEKQGEMFPALLINMVKAAEASGTLIETLDDMADYYTEIDETKKQMRSAMMYPMIITVFAVAVVTFILLVIIPQFVEIYQQNNMQLNGLTAFIIGLSDFIKHNFFLLFAILIMIIVSIYVSYKNVKAFRKSFQTFLMHIPVVKDVIIYNELAIFTKTFASLLRNNVFITESIDILSKITNNEIYKSILYKTINNIVKGEKISEAFKDHWAVPEVAYFMIVTGEETGELDNMMQKVSEYYQELHRNVVNNLKSFIEPVMIAVLALVVGVIIVSVVVPMFSMYEQVMV